MPSECNSLYQLLDSEHLGDDIADVVLDNTVDLVPAVRVEVHVDMDHVGAADTVGDGDTVVGGRDIVGDVDTVGDCYAVGSGDAVFVGDIAGGEHAVGGYDEVIGSWFFYVFFVRSVRHL